MVHSVPNCGFARSYIIAGLRGLAVIDVGSVGTVGDVSAVIGRLGKTLNDIVLIAATHFHIDHIGGIGQMLGKCPPDVKVMFHRIVGDYLTGKRKMSLTKNWVTGFIPASTASIRYIRRFSHLYFESLSGIPVPGLREKINLPYQRDRIEYFGREGQKRYSLDFDDWEVIETPGHTDDSVSFYSETSRELICGDLILNMAKSGRGELNRFYSSRESILQSFDDLARMIMPRTIYPGHGEIIQDADNALRHIKMF